MGGRGDWRKDICWTERVVRRSRYSGYRQTKKTSDRDYEPPAPIGGAYISHFSYFRAQERARP
jgi:hypothetical protein